MWIHSQHNGLIYFMSSNLFEVTAYANKDSVSGAEKHRRLIMQGYNSNPASDRAEELLYAHFGEV